MTIRRKQQKTCGCERVIKILLPGNSWYFFSGAAKQWIDLFSESKLTIKKWKKKWLCKCNYLLEQVYAVNSCKYWGRESQNNYLAVKTSDYSPRFLINRIGLDNNWAEFVERYTVMHSHQYGSSNIVFCFSLLLAGRFLGMKSP